MRYLAYGYVFFFVGLAVFDVVELRRSRYPGWVLGISAASKFILLAGMGFYLLPDAVVGAQSFWAALVFPNVALEVALQVYGIWHEEEDFELSPADKRGNLQFALGLLICILGPAIYMNLRFAFPTLIPISWAGVILAVIVGCALAVWLPRAKTCFRSISERNLVTWLEANEDLARRPDLLELVDNSRQKWPGFEEEKQCQLFRIRYGQRCFIGLTGPTTHCLDISVDAEILPAEAYDRFRAWFADDLARKIILDVAKGYTGEFRKIVEDTLTIDPPQGGESDSGAI